jgi:hypothetical protein
VQRGSFRVAVTAAVFCVSTFLLACPLGSMRMLIPDFFASDVQGIQVFRVDDATGQLVEAGSIEFLGIEAAPRGEQLQYQQLAPSGEVAFGPIYTALERDPAAPDGATITLAFMNQLPPGWFKVASYNDDGTSEVSAAQAYLATGEER